MKRISIITLLSLLAVLFIFQNPIHAQRPDGRKGGMRSGPPIARVYGRVLDIPNK